MGLMIHSLEMLSPHADREHYLYLLDYGWHEPLSNALRQNFQKMAEWASVHNSAIIMGVGDIGHFDNEVLSWHKINGQDAGELLPAILITKTNPHDFREMNLREKSTEKFTFILIPLKRCCKNETEIVNLIQSIFEDIESKRKLSEFRIQKELHPGFGEALVKSIILEPNISGVGFSFNKLVSFLNGSSPRIRNQKK